MGKNARHVAYALAYMLLLFPFSLYPKMQVLNLTDAKVSASSVSAMTPGRRITYNTDGLTMNYNFNKVFIKKLASKTDGYEFSMPGFNPTMGEGLPSVPGRVDIYYIPTGYEIDLEITQCDYQEIHGEVSPSIPVLSDSEKTPLKIAKIKDYTDFYPVTPVSVQAIKTFNDQQLIYVSVSPVLYNKEKGIIRVYSDLTYDLKYRVIDNEKRSLHKALQNKSDSYTNMFDVAGVIPLIEPSSDTDASTRANLLISGGMQRQTHNYIIITPSIFSAAANKLADWKRSQGFKVTVLSSQLWRTTSIQSRIRNIYQTNSGKFYCLLLGDTNLLPSFEKDDVPDGNKIEQYTTDLPYFCLAGDDCLPEMNYGRLPAKSLEEANTMIGKIINYELNPPVKSSFYDSASIVSVFYDTEDQSAYFTPTDNNAIIPNSDESQVQISEVSDGYEDRRYCQTTNEISEYLKNYQYKEVDKLFTFDGYCQDTSRADPTNWSMIFDFGGKVPDNLRNGNHNWDPNFCESTFFKSLNSGRTFVLYRGHGKYNLWDFILISDNGLKSLSNGSLLPVIIAIACQTGANGGEYMPHAALANKNGGAIAYIGSSGLSFSGPNEPLAHGITNAFWPNPGLPTYMRYISNEPDEPDDCLPYYPTSTTPVYELFEALQAGFLREEQVFFSSVDMNDMHREKYEVFGDPSMMLYTENPWSAGNGAVTATVTRTANSVNIQANGRIGYISFYDTSTKEVKSFIGSNYASFTTNSPESVIVTVRTPNRPLYVNKGANVNVNF